jgi:hypothetical protein
MDRDGGRLTLIQSLEFWRLRRLAGLLLGAGWQSYVKCNAGGDNMRGFDCVHDGSPIMVECGTAEVK